jgi:hypothetical protein
MALVGMGWIGFEKGLCSALHACMIPAIMLVTTLNPFLDNQQRLINGYLASLTRLIRHN